MSDNGSTGGTDLDADVVVVGAGFAGLYLVHRLREAGLSHVVVEAADDIGGTWYWNRYPGARCDIQSIDYSYSWDPELDDEWEWSEKYATQPEILRYLHHVADKHDLRTPVRFETRVRSARWDEASARWSIDVESPGGAQTLTCRHYVMATGCLSMPKTPDIEGVDRFAGPTYYTSSWPHEGVDFTGMKVGVIGTGSSGIQSIPIIADQADELVVFQRTPNFSFPAGNGPASPEKLAKFDADPAVYREEARWSGIGVPTEPLMEASVQLAEDEIERRLEEVWQRGELARLGPYADWLINPAANERMAEFIRNKIRSIVDDPETAELLCPTDHPVGTKRPCLDTNYYATFNHDHVRLVDLRATPIETITETGIQTGGDPSSGTGEEFAFDAIVFATGFDAMTGAIVNVDITGRDGRRLADEWDHGPRTYLGLLTEGFPNLYMVTGPGSPSVISNMVVSIEQHVDWILDTIGHLRDEGLDAIEATRPAQDGWVDYVNDWGDLTLYPQANSWYMGANVPGKPRVFMPYIGTVGRYRAICAEVAEGGYVGFERRSVDGRVERDETIVRRYRPDVEAYLDALAELGIPALESLAAPDARAFMDVADTARPPGPEVGEIVDGEYPGADRPMRYRLYRPHEAGPHPVVLYFHGGGWTIGHEKSDDPFCRDLCVRSGAMIVSVDYRHGPEEPFPAAIDDAWAAVRWLAHEAVALGGRAGHLAVAGWSAGGNLAAVVSLMARDAGAPHLSGQVLVCPGVDMDRTWPSYTENGEGHVLTASMMNWFADNYTDPADRTDWRAAPLLAPDHSGLPPAMVVTAEFDPLRDSGDAYAEKLAAAGTEVRHLPCPGQVHTSIHGVDVILTSAPIRAEIAGELRRMLQAEQPVNA